MAQIEEAESLVKAVLAEGSKEVSEDAFYSRDGDCVFYYAEGGPHDAIRLDGLFTVYVTEKDKRFAGFQVKGVKAFITEVAKAVSAAKTAWSCGAWSTMPWGAHRLIRRSSRRSSIATSARCTTPTR